MHFFANIVVSDIETVAILIILSVLFIFGLKKKETTLAAVDYSIDLNFSTALKGVSCIFILLGHFMNYYYNKQPDTIVSKIVFATTANIALIIFMFISGYGLSVKQKNLKVHYNLSGIWGALFVRIRKIIVPFLIVVVITHLLYLVLPNTLPEDFLIKYRLPHLSGKIIDFFNDEALPRLRYCDWYVICISMFYAIFYFALYIYNKICKYRNATPMSFTYILFVLLMLYYVTAITIIEPNFAHYYRYPWAFFAGHLFARFNDCNSRERKICFLLLGLSIFSWSIGLVSIVVNIIAIIFLCFISVLNRKYTYNGKILLWLGTLSYFFYLIHERISWLLLAYTKIISPIVWILITLVISYILNYFYILLTRKLHG